MTGDVVYRNTRLSPVTLAGLPVRELQLARNKSAAPLMNTTCGGQIIREAVDALTGAGAEPVQFRLDNVSSDL
jgi:hypothetical protein